MERITKVTGIRLSAEDLEALSRLRQRPMLRYAPDIVLFRAGLLTMLTLRDDQIVVPPPVRRGRPKREDAGV